MSRFRAIQTGTGNHILYGLDRACGWFYEESNGKIIVELDTLFTGLTSGRLIELLEATNAPDEHKTLIALDLDPAG